MGRHRGKLDFKNESADVAVRFKSEKTVWKKERLQAIKLLLETPLSYAEVSKIIGKAPSRIKEWTKQFRLGGIDQLLVKGNSGGRKPKINAEVQAALIEKLREGSFRTAKQIAHWLLEEHNVEVKPNSLYYQLGKLGGRLKVPRPSHLKKDSEKAKEFRETLADKMKDLNIPQDQEVVLWVYDEMRYGLHPLLRKMWSLIGTRVVAPVNRRFQWGYVYGAVSVEGGHSEFLYADGVSKDMDECFLKQISNSNPNKTHVIIGDGAGFHIKQGQDDENKLPENIHILTLPSYSPELNPIEKLWDIVKDYICNVCWESMEDLEVAMTKVLQDMWEQVDGFSSLFTNSYLRSELNGLWKIDMSR